MIGNPAVGFVRPHLQDIQIHDFSHLVSKSLPSDEPLVLVNARTTPRLENIRVLRQLQKEGRPGVVMSNGRVAAVVITDASQHPTVENTANGFATYLTEIGAETLAKLPVELELFEFPHDVVRVHMECLNDSLEQRLSTGAYQEIADGLFVAEDVKIGRHVVSESAKGPIVLERNVNIGALSYLEGPVHVGANARIIEHSALKDAAALGHTTKIGGEIEASIIEPYTNKQHYGFLGHSYLGSWINLGAGTCNSDLKNTYGEVNMELRGEKVPTGMQFIGCVMGDFSKSAINTCIFTGKIIGVSSMMYGFVTTNVASFVNYARLFSQITELPPTVMESTQKRMFARRGVEQRPCDIKLLHDMYELTKDERQLAGEPLSL